MKPSLHGLMFLLLASGTGATASAQVGPSPGPQPGETTVDADGSGEEAEALVRRIQESLAEVDKALEEAADQETPADGIAVARRKHLEAIRDIEALIKQIKYTQSNSPSGQGSSGGKSGQGASGGEPSGSPPAPRPSDGSSAPKPSGSKRGAGEQGEQEGEQSAKDQDGSKPTSPQGSIDGPGSNRQGTAVPPDETGTFTRTDTDARWGLLPPKLQERLMNLHVDDVPERYRTWLEAYIKALNSREQAGTTR